MNKQQEPRLRFKGFTGEWECRKLGEIAFKVKEKNIAYQYAETFTNSAEFGIISQQDFFDKSISNSENIGGYYVVQPDDFVYNPRISSFAPVGPIKRNKLGRTGVMSPLYYVFRLNDEIKPSYLEQYFEGNQWHHFMHLNGDTGARSDRFSIKNDVFAEMPISFPANKNEQTQIGNFFRRLDSQIAESRAVLEKSRQLKKAMLVKMFPANGEKMPKIRFKGFEGEWECRKFSEVAELRRGLTYSPLDISQNGIRVLRSSNIDEEYYIEKNDDVFVCERAVNIPLAQNGDILITAANGSSRLVGKHAIIQTSIPAVHGGFMLLARTENPYFLNASMSSAWYLDFIRIFVAGGNGAIGNLSIGDLNEQEILIPKHPEEQTAIGNFFRQLDETIALQSAEVEKLNQLKKGLLAAMLV